MSTPPCIIGAVIMKITSSRNITSMRFTTLISAFSASRSRRRRATSDVPFAHEQGNHRRPKRLEETFDPVETARENVVRKGRWDRDCQRGGSRHQGLGDARRDRGEIPRATPSDPYEGIDDAEHG